jgi:uncharacterized repeat protein (TIGR02543 family)
MKRAITLAAGLLLAVLFFTGCDDGNNRTLDKALTGISITKAPARTAYFINDTLDLEGIEVTASYNNHTTEIVNIGVSNVSGFDSGEAGDKTLTVLYKGKTATFDVTVANFSLIEIVITTMPTKSNYWKYEPLNLDGLVVTATFSDESTEEIDHNLLTVSDDVTAEEGEQDIIVSFNGKTVVFTVIVAGSPVVTFNSNGGSAVNAQPANYGGKAVKPTDPAKIGYARVFDGWYTDTNFTTQWNFTANTVTANIELFAKWIPYELGDTGPGGGKIYYVSETGFTVTADNSTAWYLEASPADISENAWGAYGEELIGMGEAIGTGKKNNQLILTILTRDKENGAAKDCANYNGNGFTDWFLPSKEELYQLYSNRNQAGIVLKTGAQEYYWSSTLGVGNNYQAFAYRYDTTQNSLRESPNSGRNSTYNVRAVRAF